MIPVTNKILSAEIVVKTQPSKNYKMHFDTQIISGYTDDLNAMKQVVYKILHTQRYEFNIYSNSYGIELIDLYGEPSSYVCPELERRIIEALLIDNRIENVNNFNFEVSKGKINVSFTVQTIFGDLDIEKVVDY